MVQLQKFDHSDFDVHNAAEIQDFPFDKYFVKKDTNRFDNYSLYALYAAQEAVNHANLDVEALDKIVLVLSLPLVLVESKKLKIK